MKGGEAASGHCWHLSFLSTPALPGTRPLSTASTLKVPIGLSLHITLVKWHGQNGKHHHQTIPTPTLHTSTNGALLRFLSLGALAQSYNYLVSDQEDLDRFMEASGSEGRAGIRDPSQRAGGWGPL